MTPDDAIRDAIAAAVDEILTEDLDPQQELDRLTSMLQTGFWQHYNEQTAYQQD